MYISVRLYLSVSRHVAFCFILIYFFTLTTNKQQKDGCYIYYLSIAIQLQCKKNLHLCTIWACIVQSCYFFHFKFCLFSLFALYAALSHFFVIVIYIYFMLNFNLILLSSNGFQFSYSSNLFNHPDTVLMRVIKLFVEDAWTSLLKYVKAREREDIFVDGKCSIWLSLCILLFHRNNKLVKLHF